jgi:hypothetical protein
LLPSGAESQNIFKRLIIASLKLFRKNAEDSEDKIHPNVKDSRNKTPPPTENKVPNSEELEKIRRRQEETVRIEEEYTGRNVTLPKGVFRSYDPSVDDLITREKYDGNQLDHFCGSNAKSNLNFSIPCPKEFARVIRENHDSLCFILNPKLDHSPISKGSYVINFLTPAIVAKFNEEDKTFQIFDMKTNKFSDPQEGDDVACENSSYYFVRIKDCSKSGENTWTSKSVKIQKMC